MPVTSTQIAAIVEELTQLVVPTGVQKIYERDDDGFVLQLRGGGTTHFVLVDTSSWSRIHLADRKPKQPQHPSAFVMLLRKHLVGTGLQSVSQLGDDRIVRLHFLRRSDEREHDLELVVEMFGTPTAILIDDGVIVGVRGTRHRVGDVYEAPEGAAPDSRDPLDLGSIPVGGRSMALAEHASKVVAERHIDHLRTALRADLKREAKRARRLVRNLEGDLERAEAAQQYRKRGELLQSAYSKQIGRGADSVRVPDYYEPGSPEIEIPLDPARSLQENIDRYFHEYRRMKDAIDQIMERLVEAMETADALTQARDALDDVADDALDEFAAKLRADGLLRKRRKQQRRGRSASPPPPYRTFIARSGAKILVGRGAKHNDALTTKVARGRDVWLHARDWAGAHVVLRMDKDAEPASEDLRDAALLAAHFSKGRGDSLVDVTHTRAKWVRKPKGAGPGLVTVAGGSTIGVPPDPDRLSELFDSEEQ